MIFRFWLYAFGIFIFITYCELWKYGKIQSYFLGMETLHIQEILY